MNDETTRLCRMITDEAAKWEWGIKSTWAVAIEPLDDGRKRATLFCNAAITLQTEGANALEALDEMYLLMSNQDVQIHLRAVVLSRGKLSAYRANWKLGGK